jgi:hypothetical protein
MLSLLAPVEDAVRRICEDRGAPVTARICMIFIAFHFVLNDLNSTSLAF